MTTETSDDGSDGSATHAPMRRLYHGTRDELRPGDLVAPCGSGSVCVSPDLDAAIWDAELAMGDAFPRLYVVETDRPIVDASELVGGKGNPSMAWRSSGEVRVKSESGSGLTITERLRSCGQETCSCREAVQTSAVR